MRISISPEYHQHNGIVKVSELVYSILVIKRHNVMHTLVLGLVFTISRWRRCVRIRSFRVPERWRDVDAIQRRIVKSGVENPSRTPRGLRRGGQVDVIHCWFTADWTWTLCWPDNYQQQAGIISDTSGLSMLWFTTIHRPSGHGSRVQSCT